MSDKLTIDALAQEIRRVDGNHSLGAGALAEALMPFLATALCPCSTGVTEGWVLVPKEPTEQMLAAAIGPDDGAIFGSRKLAAMSMASRYRAMLSAAGGEG